MHRGQDQELFCRQAIGQQAHPTVRVGVSVTFILSSCILLSPFSSSPPSFSDLGFPFMVPIASGEAYVGPRISSRNRDGASAATFSITVQRCIRDNRPVAAYRCNAYCMAQVFFGPFVHLQSFRCSRGRSSVLHTTISLYHTSWYDKS